MIIRWSNARCVKVGDGLNLRLAESCPLMILITSARKGQRGFIGKDVITAMGAGNYYTPDLCVFKRLQRTLGAASRNTLALNPNRFLCDIISIVMIWIILDAVMGAVWNTFTDGKGNPRWLDRVQAWVYNRAWKARKRRG